MLRRESVSGSLGGVAAPGGAQPAAKIARIGPLVPTGRDTPGARSLRPDRARGDQQRVGMTVHADRALEVIKKRQR
jgi:hypothetical protein